MDLSKYLKVKVMTLDEYLDLRNGAPVAKEPTMPAGPLPSCYPGGPEPCGGK